MHATVTTSLFLAADIASTIPAPVATAAALESERKLTAALRCDTVPEAAVRAPSWAGRATLAELAAMTGIIVDG